MIPSPDLEPFGACIPQARLWEVANNGTVHANTLPPVLLGPHYAETRRAVEEGPQRRAIELYHSLNDNTVIVKHPGSLRTTLVLVT